MKCGSLPQNLGEGTPCHAKNPPPSYRLHRQAGQGIVTLTDPLSIRKNYLLGTYDSPASRAEYVRLVSEWEANGRRLPSTTAEADQKNLTVNELVLLFWPHAEQHYRRADGTLTNELDEYKRACRPLCYLSGALPVGDFGPLALKAVRELIVNGYQHPKYGTQAPLARGVANQRTGRIRRVFRWGVENELVPVTVLQSLLAERGLQKGRTHARETEPIKPVAVNLVEQTVQHLNRFLAGLVRLQLLTGARAGELVILRPCDLDTTGSTWLYRPSSHKTEHRGKQRIIYLGPQAQAILKTLLPLSTQEYVFSASQAMAEYQEQRRRNRRSKLTPSQLARETKTCPKKQPGRR